MSSFSWLLTMSAPQDVAKLFARLVSDLTAWRVEDFHVIARSQSRARIERAIECVGDAVEIAVTASLSAARALALAEDPAVGSRMVLMDWRAIRGQNRIFVEFGRSARMLPPWSASGYRLSCAVEGHAAMNVFDEFMAMLGDLGLSPSRRPERRGNRGHVQSIVQREHLPTIAAAVQNQLSADRITVTIALDKEMFNSGTDQLVLEDALPLAEWDSTQLPFLFPNRYGLGLRGSAPGDLIPDHLPALLRQFSRTTDLILLSGACLPLVVPGDDRAYQDEDNWLWLDNTRGNRAVHMYVSSPSGDAEQRSIVARCSELVQVSPGPRG